MSKKEETSSPSLKRSWFQELKAEFGKITWPTKDKLVRLNIKCSLVNMKFNRQNLIDFICDKETEGVDKWDIVLGFIIAGVDYLLQIGLTYIVG